MGLEAIAFIPDQAHPEGGTFWVGNQSFSLKPDRELSVVCQIEIPLKTEATSVSTGRIVQFFPLNIIDVSGIVYDQLRDCLLVMSDTTNLLLEIFQDGEYYKEDNLDDMAVFITSIFEKFPEEYRRLLSGEEQLINFFIGKSLE